MCAIILSVANIVFVQHISLYQILSSAVLNKYDVSEAAYAIPELLIQIISIYWAQKSRFYVFT
jgi:hypothetical protein